MLTRKSFGIIGIILLTVILCFSIDFFFLRQKIGFVELNKAFEEFEMKKELSKIYETELRSIQIEQDSLSNVIQKLKINFSALDLEKSDEYTHAMYSLKLLLDNKTHLEEVELSKLDNQIHERLTVYLKEYAALQNLDLLILSSNNYPVIYAGQSTDMTNDAIKFVNDAYNDK